MKITKIELQKKNNKRYSIYLDEEFSFGIHEDVLIKCGLHKDQIISQEYINEILNKEEQSKANHYAINLISYRARSTKEVKDKMIDKGYSIATIDQTVAFLKENKLLNDLEFAKMFIRDKTSLSRHSIIRVKNDLRQKGVDKEIVQEAIDSISDPDYENAKYLSFKKYEDLKSRKKYSDSSDYDIKQKVYQYMNQKGFNIYLVKDALLDAITNDIEEDNWSL